MAGPSHFRDGELEFADAYCHKYTDDSQRSNSAEQAQGLLGDWKELRGDAAESYGYAKRKPWKWVMGAATVPATLGILIISVVFVLRLGSMSRSEVNAGALQDTSNAPRVQTNDYLLDPNWNYDAAPRRREYNWTIKDQIHNPDGIYRPMMLVNNQFPGPLIEVNEGDTIVVYVDNRAMNATSIHWHGIYQNGTPHMDGTVGITQCPIAPGGKFTYEFTVNGQSGTYWWHAHQGVQSSDGLHGPLIIHGKDERNLQRIKYESDRVVLVADHYHDLSSALLWNYLKPDMENSEPIPESALINGRATRNCDDYPDRRCDTSNLAPILFGLGRKQSHRLRIINVGAIAEFQVQIDQHELAVTEVDGTDVAPVKYHRISVSPGQRYSVVVNATAAGESFWFRARMITNCFKEKSTTLQPDVQAVVRYTHPKHKTASLPTSLDWEEQLQQDCKDMNTTDLKPVQAIAPPANADAFFYFRANFEIGSWRLSRGFFDSSTWRPDVRSPSLLRTIEGVRAHDFNFTASAASSPVNNAAFINDAAFDKPHEYVLQTMGTQTIDILVSNFDDGTHPLHLHGYKYFVLAQGHGYPPMINPIDGTTRENVQPLFDSLDLSNPLRRDTASVEGFGWILLRLVADNPGAWAFHCHVSWHTEAGLLMQFLTKVDALADDRVYNMTETQAHRDLCGADGIEKGMGPKDEDYKDLAK